VLAVEPDLTVRLRDSDDVERRVWLYGLDMYAPDSPVRQDLARILLEDTMPANGRISCRIREGFVFTTRLVALCTDRSGDIGAQLIEGGAADVCRRQMRHMPRGLDYAGLQSLTHRARLRIEVNESEECAVRGYLTRDPDAPAEEEES